VVLSTKIGTLQSGIPSSVSHISEGSEGDLAWVEEVTTSGFRQSLPIAGLVISARVSNMAFPGLLLELSNRRGYLG